MKNTLTMKNVEIRFFINKKYLIKTMKTIKF